MKVFLLNRYTLLVGKPPFETSCLKDTYMKIKKNEYHVPSRVSLPAKNLIMKLLKGDPTDRPNMETLLEEEFFHTGKLLGGNLKSVQWCFMWYMYLVLHVNVWWSFCFMCRIPPAPTTHQLFDHGPQVWYVSSLWGIVSTSSARNQQSRYDTCIILKDFFFWLLFIWLPGGFLCDLNKIIRNLSNWIILLGLFRWEFSTPDGPHRYEEGR